jgi:GrpB-like predicted nucleotidyltransferase (UPF0157 family)
VKNLSRIIEVLPYDPNWVNIFAYEAKLMQDALGANCTYIHHIGSTAVPGLAAKPIIDMIPVVQRLDKIDDSKLVALGYTPRGELGMPFRRFYNKGDPRSHHLHIWEEGNPEISKHLLFRDYLIAHSDVADKYADLKYKLAMAFSTDRKNYTEAKDALIKNIIIMTGFAGFTVVEVNLPNERLACEKIQQIEKLIISDNDLYFVLMQGANIVGAAHIQKHPTNIESVKCENLDQEKYMREIINKWLTQSLSK